MNTKRPTTYTTKEAAEILQVSEWTIWNLRRQGRLAPLDLGLRSVRFAKEDIDRLARTTVPSKQAAT